MNAHRQHPDNDLTKDQVALQGIPTASSLSKADQVNKEFAEENGQKDASWKSAHEPEAKNQLQEDNGEVQRQEFADTVQKELQGEIDRQESKSQTQDNDYYSGMSQ